MHSTLKIKTNTILIIIWFLISCIIFAFLTPYPVIIFFTGFVLGMISGLLQLMSMKKTMKQLKSTNTMIEVRNILKSTRLGNVFIYFNWLSFAVLLIISFILYPEKLYNILVGYISMVLIRDIITFKAILELNKR